MGLKYTNFFDSSSYEPADTQIIICRGCSSHLCLSQLILSDEFRGSSGPAYLVDKLINYAPDPDLEETVMHTGTYVIRKVRCHQCNCRLGWTYKKSFSYSQTYKEGKFVIERKYIKMIPNNLSTALLVEKARLNSRRRSSGASSGSSIEYSPSSEIILRTGTTKQSRDFKIRGISGTSIDLGNGQSGSFLNRLRFQGVDKEELDEDQDVFVGV